MMQRYFLRFLHDERRGSYWVFGFILLAMGYTYLTTFGLASSSEEKSSFSDPASFALSEIVARKCSENSLLGIVTIDFLNLFKKDGFLSGVIANDCPGSEKIASFIFLGIISLLYQMIDPFFCQPLDPVSFRQNKGITPIDRYLYFYQIFFDNLLLYSSIYFFPENANPSCQLASKKMPSLNNLLKQKNSINAINPLISAQLLSFLEEKPVPNLPAFWSHFFLVRMLVDMPEHRPFENLLSIFYETATEEMKQQLLTSEILQRPMYWDSQFRSFANAFVFGTYQTMKTLSHHIDKKVLKMSSAHDSLFNTFFQPILNTFEKEKDMRKLSSYS